MSKYGGIDRTHDRSFGPKLVFAVLHGMIVALCLWLAFGGFDWPDQPRAIVLAFCAVLYWIRHLVTLFLLLQRKVDLSEGLGLTLFIAVFEIGFLLLGTGVISSTQTPLGGLDLIGLGLILAGSYLNTGSELQRKRWKKRSSSKGRCYTGGLFAYSMHINYLGDSVLFTGWAILAASVIAFTIPILITGLFVFYHIPLLDAYLADRYGAEFKAYKDRTAKFVPYLY